MASAAERQKQRVIDSLKEGFEELFSAQSQKAVTGVERESPEVSISEISQRMAGVLVENLYGVQDWRLLKNKPTTLQGFGISQSDSYLSSLSYFSLDEEGNVYTEKNLYSKKGVSAFGFEESGDTPGSVDVLINWEDYSEEKELWALSVKLGKSLLDGKKDNFADDYYSKPGHKHTINDISNFSPYSHPDYSVAPYTDGTLGHITTATLNSLKSILNWFEWDAVNEAVKVKHTFYSTGGLSAFGLGNTGSGGGGVDVLIDWASYDSSKESWALSAKLGVGLNTSLAGKQDTILPGTYAAYNHNHSIANILDYVPYAHPSHTSRSVGGTRNFIKTFTSDSLGHITGITTEAMTKSDIELLLTGDEITSHYHDSRYHKKNELFELKGSGTTEDPYVIEAKYTLYSLKGLSAFGLGNVGGGGAIFDRLDNWIDYDVDKATWVLSAKLGNELYTSVQSLSSASHTHSNYSLLNSLTSSDIARWDGKENASNKNIAGGYAGLDSSGKLYFSQFPDVILGQLKYGGTINSSKIITSEYVDLNGISAEGLSATLYKGYYFIAQANITVNGVELNTGDWFLSNGAAGWTKVDNTDAISLVNGKTGNVTLYTDDISETGSPTNLWFTETRVRSSLLTGYSVGSNSAISATDSLLSALGKIQGQINARALAVGSYSYSGFKVGSLDVNGTSLTKSELDFIKQIISLFEWDGINSAIKALYTLYSVGGLSSFGLGDVGSGGGTSSVITIDDFNEIAYDANKALSAYAGARLNTSLSQKQPLSSSLSTIAAINIDGLLRRASGNWVVDNTSYATVSQLSGYATTSSLGNYSLVGHTHSSFYNTSGYAGNVNDLIQDYRLVYTPYIMTSSTNLFPISNNANAILSIATHGGGYNHQLGFSSNGNIYSRSFAAGTPGSWKTLLDSGNFSSYALPLSGGTINGNGDSPLSISTTASSNYLTFAIGGYSKSYFGWYSFLGTFLQNNQGNQATIGILDDNTPYYSPNAGFSKYTLVHAGNIGSQSVNYAASAGNADTLDGYHHSSFATSGHDHSHFYTKYSYPNNIVQSTMAETLSGAGQNITAMFASPTLWGGGEYANAFVYTGYNQYGSTQLITLYNATNGNNKMAFRVYNQVLGGYNNFTEVWTKDNLTNTLTNGYIPYWNATNGRLENSGMSNDGVYTNVHQPIRLTNNGYYLGSPAHGHRFNDYNSNYNNFIIYENGNTYTRGNVGIGTTSPTSRLHIETNTWDAGGYIPLVKIINLDVNAVDSAGLLVRGGALDSTSKILDIQDYNGVSKFYVSGDGNSVMGGSLTLGGNVGIGYTTDQGRKLAVNGSGYFASVLTVQPNTGSYSEGIRLGAYGGWSNIQFKVDTASLIGTQSGQWLIGVNPANTWCIVKGGSESAVANPPNGLSIPYDLSNIRFNSNIIYHAGNANRSDTAWTASTLTATTSMTSPAYYHSSDMRLKNVVKPLENVLDKIRNFSTFLYTEKSRLDLGLQLGMSAQDFELYFPTIVSKDKFGYLGLQYPRISVIAIKAIQELDSKQSQQERRIVELEREVKTLKEKLYGSVNN